MNHNTKRALLLSLALLLAGCAGAGSSSSGGSATGETKPSEETRGEEVARMSVREAVGQMFVVSMNGTEPDYYVEKMIRERNIGGVILFGPNMRSEEGTRRLTRSL